VTNYLSSQTLFMICISKIELRIGILSFVEFDY
jgi:hypothetical protein